jgi:hypothetical protein
MLISQCPFGYIYTHIYIYICIDIYADAYIHSMGEVSMVFVWSGFSSHFCFNLKCLNWLMSSTLWWQYTEQVVEKVTSSMTWVRFKVAYSSSSRLLQYNTKQREYTRYKICIHKLHPYLWARLHHIHSEIHLRHTTARLIGAVYWFCACSRWQSPSTRNIWIWNARSDMFCILRHFMSHMQCTEIVTGTAN